MLRSAFLAAPIWLVTVPGYPLERIDPFLSLTGFSGPSLSHSRVHVRVDPLYQTLKALDTMLKMKLSTTYLRSRGSILSRTNGIAPSSTLTSSTTIYHVQTLVYLACRREMTGN